MNTARRSILGNAIVGYDLEQFALAASLPEEDWRIDSAVQEDAAATLMDRLRAGSDKLREAQLVENAKLPQSDARHQD